MKDHNHSHDLNIKKVDRLSPTKVRLTLEFAESVLREHQQSTANRYLQMARIPGFRPGKAPIKMIRERFKNEILQDVVSHLLEAGLAEALKQTKLVPLNRPQIELGEAGVAEGKPFEFKAEFEVQPEIELRSYKGVPLKRADLDTSEDEVSKTLDNLRERLAVLEPVETEKAEKGLYVVAEIGYELVGEPAKKEAAKSFTVQAGEEGLMPELDAALLDMKVGESREVTAKFPDDYTDKELAGREAVFQVKLLEVKRKVLPELNDAFASQLREGATLETLNKEIRESIANAKQEEGRMSERQQIIDYLVKNNHFEVPDTLVDRQAVTMIQRIEQDYRGRGLPPPPLKQEDLSSIRKHAEQLVRGSLLLKEVAVKEKLAIDDTKLDDKIQALAGKLNRTVEDTRSFLEGKGLIDQIKDEVLTDQVFEFLLGTAEVETSKNK